QVQVGTGHRMGPGGHVSPTLTHEEREAFAELGPEIAARLPPLTVAHAERVPEQPPPPPPAATPVEATDFHPVASLRNTSTPLTVPPIPGLLPAPLSVLPLGRPRGLPQTEEQRFLQRAEASLRRGTCDRFLLGLQEITEQPGSATARGEARYLRAR